MSDTENGTVTTTEVRIRRAPKYPAFMIVGGGVGAIATFIATALQPVDPAVGFAALFGYFALFGVTAGVALGAMLALLLDWRASRRATSATAELTSVEELPAEEPSVEELPAAAATPDDELLD